MVPLPTDSEEYPSARTARGRWWTRFILGALAVFVVWFFFVRPTAVELTRAQQEQLLTLARRQLAATVAGEGFIEVYIPDLSDRLLRTESAFVSLTRNGVLRGCMIDQLAPHEPLVTNVLRNVQLAAQSDERFQAVTQAELDLLRIKISLVVDLKPLPFSTPEELAQKLSPHVDGVVLSVGDELATYLPSVWETFPDSSEFLSQLCIKAGWPADRWRSVPYPDVQIYRVYEFGEP